ncbi:DUF6196 family protein [Actinacidiphila guanduensis]|uniref:Uncharacterized protein n=1 Tax=Actinacidiphila guanduensis TaxID=310781 RepID=A0A1H0B3Z0_9ACTN|nr:DUF6196 family protein [Actinacidiphila guanduensis]SDN40404.1 hypothetical protein SAMN05216259_10441 [Actinacidiphila guanduensis]
MVSVSRETSTQTRTRLRTVIANSEIVVFDGAWSFVETPMDQPPHLDERVLAVVRDDECWSALRPDDGSDGDRERFGLLSFHFPPGLDNSGFVGWLATELKERLGTGLFVVCGSNSDRGGIYDYWGCPLDLLDDVVGVIRELADPSASPS